MSILIIGFTLYASVKLIKYSTCHLVCDEQLSEKNISFLQLTQSSFPRVPQIYFNFVIYQLMYARDENKRSKPVFQ